MGRRLATIALAVAPLAAVVGVAAGAAPASSEQPPKTTAPSGPARTLWPTASIANAAPSTTGVAPPPSTTTGAPVPTGAPAPITFDGYTFLNNFYGQLALDPFAAARMADTTAPGS